MTAVVVTTQAAPTSAASQRFALNLVSQLKAGSTWAIGVGLILAGVLAAWPGLAEFVDKTTGVTGAGVLVAAMLGALAAKFRPSTTASQMQAMTAELARHALNEQLRAHGLPEAPANPEVTAKLPAAATPTVQVTTSAPVAETPSPVVVPAAAAQDALALSLAALAPAGTPVSRILAAADVMRGLRQASELDVDLTRGAR